MSHQEFIRDKSVQPRIPTVNDILHGNENINIVTCPRVTVLLRHFRKTELYTRGYAVAHSYLLCTLGHTNSRMFVTGSRGQVYEVRHLTFVSSSLNSTDEGP